MFKQIAIAIAALLSCSVVLAQIVPASSVEEAQKQAEEKCKEGCLILSPIELAYIETTINKAIQEAYQAGLKGWNTVTSK